MDSLHSIMPKHKKGKHLSLEERVIIQTRIKDGFSLRAIARELCCSPSTISYEVRRGTVTLYRGKQKRYKADHGQGVYQTNRRHCGRKSDFIKYVNKHFFEDNWSLDVCANRCLAVGEFSSDQIVCTRTLYNYVDQGLLAIRNSDLPEKLKRNTKIHRVHKNKKKLGRSIEERPKEINDRKEFGHWECDLVLGHKTRDDQVLLTLSERMSREFLILRIPDKTAASVMSAFQTLHKQYSEHWNEIFKTITTDNGSEFADLSNLEEVSNTLVYYAHPYTSCDKGTVERHNGLIRRFIPKGDYINNYSLQEIMTLKPGAIRYQEKYWHIIHQMKSLKENWIISIKQLKCSIYYCNLRIFFLNEIPKTTLTKTPIIPINWIQILLFSPVDGKETVEVVLRATFFDCFNISILVCLFLIVLEEIPCTLTVSNCLFSFASSCFSATIGRIIFFLCNLACSLTLLSTALCFTGFFIVFFLVSALGATYS